MPRPSQCVACGCFEHCLNPESPQCAERPFPTAAVDRNIDVEAILDDMEPPSAVRHYAKVDPANFDANAFLGAVLDVDDHLEAMQEYGERVAEESAPPDDDRDYQLSLLHDEDV